MQLAVQIIQKIPDLHPERLEKEVTRILVKPNCCPDVDLVAYILTNKIVSILDIHAPWIVFQRCKNYVPLVTDSTLKLMKDRDELKLRAREIVNQSGVSTTQQEVWSQYTKLGNKVISRIRQEEVLYKKQKCVKYS